MAASASAKRAAGVRGDLDHFGALGFLQGMLTVLRDCGHSGLLLVLDEVEPSSGSAATYGRSPSRCSASSSTRSSAGRLPGLFLVITGTPAFYGGQQGVQRLASDFTTDPRFDSPRAVQPRLPGST